MDYVILIYFKQQFYPSAWANYERAKVSLLKLVPPKERISELSKDYEAMRSMIVGSYPSLENIIEILQTLEAERNHR